MRKMIFFMVVLLLSFSLVCAFAGGGGEKKDSAAGDSGSPGGTITLYTSVPQPIVDRIQNDFMKKYPAITLDAFRSGTSAVITKIMTEKEAGQIMGDLVWVAEPSTYEEFKDQGLLVKFNPPEAKNLSKEMVDPDGYYYAGRLINMVIGYNTTKVKEPPKSWKDLINKKYGEVGFPTPLRSGAALASVETIVEKYGWEYFEKFKAMGGKQVQSNSTSRDMIVTGELSVGVLLDYMVRPLMAKGSPINYVWPSDGAVFIPSPIAILKDTKNQKAAELFVNYILSPEGQEAIVKVGDFYPVRKDVASPAGAPDVKSIKKLPTDWKAVKENTKQVNENWTKIFGE